MQDTVVDNTSTQISAKINEIREMQSDYRIILCKAKPDNIAEHEEGRAFKFCLIGRAADCDYVVNDKSCSRQHCVIYFQKDRPVVRDLYSRSGTLVNGYKITPFEDKPL